MAWFFFKRQLKNLFKKSQKVVMIAKEAGENEVYDVNNWVDVQTKVNKFNDYINQSIGNKLNSYIPFTGAFKKRLEVAKMLNTIHDELKGLKDKYLPIALEKLRIKKALANLKFIQVKPKPEPEHPKLSEVSGSTSAPTVAKTFRNPFTNEKLQIPTGSRSAPDIRQNKGEHSAPVYYVGPIRPNDDKNIKYKKRYENKPSKTVKDCIDPWFINKPIRRQPGING